ncbi:hypothetical protein TSAR_016315, partial [Trichomalopsis sarcophagae]
RILARVPTAAAAIPSSGGHFKKNTSCFRTSAGFASTIVRDVRR